MAEARVDLVLGNSQFLQGISQADAAQKRFANNWEANVGRIFKRSPFMRAERAIEEFSVMLGSGNLLGAVTALGSRITGLGLGIGVALGAGIGLFGKFRQELAAAEQASAALNAELGRPIIGALGPEALTNQIEKFTQVAAQNEQKGRFSRAFQRMFAGPLGSTVGGVDQARIREQRDVEDYLTRLVKERSDAEVKLIEAKAKGLTSDKLSTSLLQNQLQAEKSIAELRLRAFNEARGPGKHSVLDDFANFFRSAGAFTRLQQAQDTAAQRNFFQESVRGFNPRSAAITEDFLREKIAADPFGPGVAQMRLQADQLNLFRQNAKLEELKDLEQNTIAYGPGARLFQQRNRDAIADQQKTVMDQSNRVMKEQADVSGSSEIVGTLIEIRNKMDEYWK